MIAFVAHPDSAEILAVLPLRSRPGLYVDYAQDENEHLVILEESADRPTGGLRLQRDHRPSGRRRGRLVPRLHHMPAGDRRGRLGDVPPVPPGRCVPGTAVPRRTGAQLTAASRPAAPG